MCTAHAGTHRVADKNISTFFLASLFCFQFIMSLIRLANQEIRIPVARCCKFRLKGKCCQPLYAPKIQSVKFLDTKLSKKLTLAVKYGGKITPSQERRRDPQVSRRG